MSKKEQAKGDSDVTRYAMPIITTAFSSHFTKVRRCAEPHCAGAQDQGPCLRKWVLWSKLSHFQKVDLTKYTEQHEFYFDEVMQLRTAPCGKMS
jgi:hypothetical protein